MNKIKKLLEISGIINIILSLLLIPHLAVWGVILLVAGILLLSYSFLSIEELQNKKIALLIMAIIMFIFNFIVGILIIVILDAIARESKTINNNSPPTTEIVTAETKRIDLLLKVGLGMVITSGILFATTSWDVISDLVKVIILIVMGIIFLGLSKFSEVKLKIRRTTIGYYILGLAFLLFSWIGVGYFGIFSTWFSYGGEGSHLVYFITLILTSFILYIISNKFSKKEYAYIAFMNLYLSIYHLFTFIGLTIIQVVTILTTISIFINIFSKSKNKPILTDMNKIASYIYWILIVSNCGKENFIITLIASILNIINQLYLSLKNKDDTYNIFTIIVIYFLILASVINININLDKFLIFLGTISILSVLLRISKPTQQKTLLNTNQLAYIFTSIITVIILSTYDCGIKLLLAIIIQLLTNIINSINWYKNNYHEISYYTQPLSLAVFSFGISAIIDANVFTFTLTNFLSVVCLIFGLMHFFIREEKLKHEYFISFIVVAVLTYLINFIAKDIFTAVGIVISSIYVYFSNNKLDSSKNFKLLAYLFILLNIHTTIYIINILSLPSIYNSLVVLLTYGILLLTLNDSKLKTATYIVLLIPIYNMLNSAFTDEIIRQILFNILQIYILFLIVKLFIKNKEAMDIVTSIGLIAIIAEVIFIKDLLMLLYIGILAIIIIIMSFNKTEYKTIFYTGIGITIGNIIIQLWNYWEQIPFWLYLLLAGIFLIVIVTYKEINKKEFHDAKEVNKNEINYESQNIQKNHSEIVYCPQCGTKTRGGNFCPGCGKKNN